MIIKANGTNQNGFSRLTIESSEPIDIKPIADCCFPDNPDVMFTTRKPDGSYYLTIGWKSELERCVTYLRFPWSAKDDKAIIVLSARVDWYEVSCERIPNPRDAWTGVKNFQK